jgi:hypothetical protein
LRNDRPAIVLSMMDHTNKEKSEAYVSSGVRSRLKATTAMRPDWWDCGHRHGIWPRSKMDQ